MNLCYACDTILTPDGDSTYQYDNALWITLGGGYGMFVESDSFMKAGDFWHQLPKARRIQAHLDFRAQHGIDADPDDIDPNIMVNPDSLQAEWEAWYEENRDDQVIICHECAHKLCDAVPWFKRLINPHNSHSHKTAYVEANPDHFGWDYDSRAARK